MNQLIFVWGSIIFTILLVGGITYVYSRGNVRLTVAFMALSIAITVLVKASKYLQYYLYTHFIGRIDIHTNTPYMVYPPGWKLLWQTWPFWLIPCFVVALLMGFLALMVFKKFKRIEPNIDEKTISNHQYSEEQKEIDQLTHTLLAMNAKLTRAKVENNQLIDQQDELTQQLEALQKSHEEDLIRFNNERKVMKFELQAKNEMIEVVQKELETLNEENKQLKLKLKEALSQ